MELKDICSISYSFEGLQPFCIQSAANGTFSILSKSCVQILKPQFSFSMDLNRFNFQVDRLQCPQSCPTNQLDTNEVEIYQRATHSQKQDILIDQRFLPKLSNVLIQSRAVAWSTVPNSRGDHYLAYLSNYGGLEVFGETSDGTWQSCLNVGNHWFADLVKDCEFPIKTFTDLDQLVQEILMTALCWGDALSGISQRLLCATKSNKFVLFSLTIEPRGLVVIGAIEIQSVTETRQKHVTTLKWLQLDEAAFVVAGSLDGKICLYSVDNGGTIELKTTLWDEEDQIAVGTVESFVHQERVLLAVVKGAHVLFFLLDMHGSLLSEVIELLPGFSITGIIPLDPLEFLVCTLDACSHVIALTATEDKLVATTAPVSYTFNLSNYSLYGVAASPNKAYYVLASFATETYDHLALRQPANFVICRSTTVNPVQTLIANPMRNLHLMMDYAEVVRYMGGKDVTQLRAHEAELDLDRNVSLSREFCSRLRVAVIVNAARYSYYRLRSNEETQNTRLRSQALFHLVQAIHAFRVLSQLFNAMPNITSWTDGQKQAGRALLTFLEVFCNSDTPFSQVQFVQLALAPLLAPIIEATKLLYELWPIAEICTFCDQPLPLEELTCADGHKTPRCSITKLQISTLSPTTCPHCRHGVLEDTRLLQEVTLGSQELLTCVLCNVPFDSLTH